MEEKLDGKKCDEIPSEESQWVYDEIPLPITYIVYVSRLILITRTCLVSSESHTHTQASSSEISSVERVLYKQVVQLDGKC